MSMSVVDDRTTRLTVLRSRFAQAEEYMSKRVRLDNGELGYKLTARTSIDVVVGSDVDDPNALREKIDFVSTVCEILVPDPTLTLDGALRFDIEIFRLIVEGESTKIFNGEPMRMIVGRGVEPMLRPTFGRMEVPDGHIFGSMPLKSTQWVNLVVETPIGRLHNREAAEMVSNITTIPPIGNPYLQQGNVPLYNDDGLMSAVKAATMSVLTGEEE
jgi:hypothetical protein